MFSFIIATKSKDEVIDITDKVAAFAKGKESGLINVFAKHASCAIATGDMDPGTDKDYTTGYRAVAPNVKYNHPHDPSHFNDHLLSTTIGINTLIPVENGDLVLGPWQKIILLEFAGPREREIVLSFIKES